MPVLTSNFRPPRWLRNGHLQTILPVLWQRGHPPLPESEVWELSDGDFLGLRWNRAGHQRLAMLSHGLEGSTDAGYIQGMAAALSAAQWDVLAWNFRGCGPLPNRLLRFYHSGETGDLRLLIERTAPAYPAGLALIGFSLGGNMTLKYLGEAPPHPAVLGGVAISAPVDLAASARTLDQRWDNRLYLRRFLKTLVAKVEAKARAFPGELNVTGIRGLRNFQGFDDRYTARLHGFRNAADYWSQASSKQYLGRITVPTLLLNARDDPFLPPECFPFPEADQNSRFFLESPTYGGHVGFMDFADPTGHTYAERRTVEFLSSLTRPS